MRRSKNAHKQTSYEYEMDWWNGQSGECQLEENVTDMNVLNS